VVITKIAGAETQTYDNKGRIDENNVGKYNYTNSAKKYQNTSVFVNNDADDYYASRARLDIDYNVFKAPVSIKEENTDKLSFLYNAFNQRSAMYYGGLSDDKMQRKFRKYYSGDGSVEIKYNTENGEVEFLTYIGGDGYSAPIVLKSDGNIEEFLYLHRDYQGTIVAISNQAGNIVEKRVFDAWGSVVKVQDEAGQDLEGLTLLDRGYTGHEHLQSIGLVHMNGRLYDPRLHRFLQPDNYVQDPYNTQCYNRYGYVYNNPLKYTDPSGEIAPLLAVAIGAAIAATTYTLTALLADVPFTIGGLVKATFIGALTSYVTWGIGEGVAAIPQLATRLTYQALAHGLTQGLVSGVQGGNNFWQGFASGALSSLSASLYGGSGYKDASGNFISQTRGLNGVIGGGDLGTILFGSVSGGGAAALTGGNFWQGAAAGLAVSLLNHVVHNSENPNNRMAREISEKYKLDFKSVNRFLNEHPITFETDSDGREFYSFKGTKIRSYVYKFSESNNQKIIGFALNEIAGQIMDKFIGPVTSTVLSSTEFNMKEPDKVYEMRQVQKQLIRAITLGAAKDNLIMNMFGPSFDYQFSNFGGGFNIQNSYYERFYKKF
jgi:RHS repeat-associated protein